MIVDFRLPLNQPNFSNAVSAKLCYKSIFRDIFCPVVGPDNYPDRVDLSCSWDCRPSDNTEFVFLSELIDGTLGTLGPEPEVPRVVFSVIAKVVNDKSLVLGYLDRWLTGLSRS